MPSLREVQTAFRDVLLGGDAAPALDSIAGDGLAVAARLAIYRHHVGATLTDVLRATFPVVCRLVDERFFGYAADRFIAAFPPEGPCLHEYGERFPAFLASFPPCRALVYLPDVARLEWAMCRAEHADDADHLDPRALAGIEPSAWPRLRFALHPSITLLASPWPVDRIWRANQPGADPETLVDLDAGGVRLELRRRDDDVVFRALDRGAYALRRVLHEGRTLAAAADAALAEDRGFGLAAALSELFTDDSLVDVTHTTEENEPCTPCP
jgi:hypothetical protein